MANSKSNFLDEQIGKRLQLQFTRELQAAYHYYCASSWCGMQSLEGLQKWFINQSSEEREHAHKIYEYLLARDVGLMPGDLVAGRNQFSKPSELFSWGLELEIQVEKDYKEIADLCLQLKDFTTYQFVDWFLKEQVEEIEVFKTYLDKVSAVESDPAALYIFDRELME